MTAWRAATPPFPPLAGAAGWSRSAVLIGSVPG